MKWSEVLEAWSDSLKSVAGMEFKVLLIPIVWDYNFYQALNKGLCKDTQSLRINQHLTMQQETQSTKVKPSSGLIFRSQVVFQTLECSSTQSTNLLHSYMHSLASQSILEVLNTIHILMIPKFTFPSRTSPLNLKFTYLVVYLTSPLRCCKSELLISPQT